MAPSFHQFGNLPWELRDQIWNLAVRPDCPGIQIFELYNREDTGPLENMRPMVLDEDYADADADHDHQLIIPDSDESNISTYLIDGGLWTACKESRRVMERRFRPNRKPKNRQLHWEKDAAATGYYIGHHGVQDPTIIDWDQVDLQIPLGSSILEYQGRLNIAIEYKSEWGLQLGKVYPDYDDLDIVEKFVRMAIDTTSSCSIWFVDHNLRRKRDISTSGSTSGREEPVTFSARGQRLVEFQLHHLDQWEYVKEVEVEEDDTDNSDSMAFARAVDVAASDQWESYERFNQPPCSIGLLGWDSL